MTLSNGSVRWATQQHHVAVLEESLATVYRDFVDTHGYADPEEDVSLSWGNEFGSLEFFKYMGVKHVLIIINVELIKVNT